MNPIALLEPQIQPQSAFVSRRRAGVAGQETFENYLAIERKRTDRTGAHFALIILNFSRLDPVDHDPQVERLLETVSERIRETDFLGWYAFPSSVGILFTAFGNADLTAVENALTGRVAAATAETLGQLKQQLVKQTFHMFPENSPSSDLYRHDEALYPDVAHFDDTRMLYRAVKRVMDIAGSVFALLVLLPLFALISACIRLSSKGPVLFRQKRIGRFGREFSLLKFRTMHVQNDSAIHKEYVRNLIENPESVGKGENEPCYKIVNDPRVTAVGRFLRKTSLDELPQFLNVLMGDMSLVGPRPPIPYEVTFYKLWHRRRLIEVKPGITGLWQVFGRSRTTFDDMVRLDLRYARHQSLWLDVQILLKTPFAVISRSGAY